MSTHKNRSRVQAGFKQALFFAALIIASATAHSYLMFFDTADESVAINWTIPDYVSDGNWETSAAVYRPTGICSPGSSVSYLYENYTLWSHINRSVTPIVRVKYNNVTLTAVNYTLPSACWSYSTSINKVMLSFQSYYQDGYGVGTRGYCYSGSGWELIYENNYYACETTGARMFFFESGVYFDTNLTPEINATSVNCLSECVYYFSHTAASTINLSILNFSGLIDYTAPQLKNTIVSGAPAYLFGNDSLAVDTKFNKTYSLKLCGSNTQTSYPTLSTGSSSNETINLSISNFNRISDNRLYAITYYNENLSVFSTVNASINLTVYCAAGSVTLPQTSTKYILSTSTTPYLLRARVYNSSNKQKYYRDLIPNTNNITFFLMDPKLDVTQYTFTIFEYTQTYVTPYIEIGKTVNGSYLIYTQTPFDYSGAATVYLIGDSYYNITIADNRHSTSLGSRFISEDVTYRTFYISANVAEVSSRNISYAYIVNQSTDTILFFYNDPTRKTSKVTLKVYNRSEHYLAPTLLYNTSVESSSALLNYTHQHNTSDVILLVAEMNYSSVYFNISTEVRFREDEDLINVEQLPENILGLSKNNWLILISIATIATPLLIFNIRYMSIGLLLSAGATLFTTLVLKWLPLRAEYYLLIVVLVILYKFRENRQVS